MKDPKIWNIIGWVAFVLTIITVVIYFFVDESYVEAPTWLIASIASWFYRDYLSKEKQNESQ